MNFFLVILLIVAFVTAYPSQPSIRIISSPGRLSLAELRASQIAKGLEAIIATKATEAVEVEKLCIATNSTSGSCSPSSSPKNEDGNGNQGADPKSVKEELAVVFRFIVIDSTSVFGASGVEMMC
ncbi:hypothetical protein FPQ18DRAFT_304219 [Pyronema domesticum]|nr:hypothetical protein FPQ18DRAFT_304219 [Pyronema domesticum]